MPLYRKMKSPLGYQNLTNSSFDSYGVDHSGFTTRDELEYQFARQERENLLMDQEQQNGVTDNFTQYGHNFWGTPSENNFGFGSSNISENIERLQKTFMTPPIQPVIEEPQLTGSLFDTPVGYQSLLPEDDSSNNFLEESSGYPSSSYNSLTSSSPQSLMQSSVQAPATTSLTGGGLNPNAFGSSSNNFSYPNAFGSQGGTLTERMAATLKARETPYNSSSSTDEHSFNSSLSSDFSNNNPHQNDPLWQELSSYSIDQLNELNEMIKKAKEEERLYGSSPIKQSLLDHLFAIKQAHAGTLSSMEVENNHYQFSGFEPYKNKQQALFQNTFEEENSLDSSIDQLQQKKQIHPGKPSDFAYQTLKSTGMLNNIDLTDDINRHMDALKAFEGRTRRIYFDANGNPTIGIGKLIDDYQIDKDNIWILTPEQKTQLKADLEMIKHHFNPKTGGLKNLSSNKQIQIFEDLVRGKDVATITDGKIKSLSSKELEAFKRIYSYQLTGNRPEELVHEHFAIIKPAIEKFLKQNNLKWHELNNAQKDMILDISYNPGVPLSSWTNFGESLRYNNPGATGVETHRKGIQALRNNYNLLRGLPEFKNLSPQELINKLQVFGNIELTKDNVNFYMNKLGIKTNPFKERESWEFERFVKRL